MISTHAHHLLGLAGCLMGGVALAWLGMLTWLVLDLARSYGDHAGRLERHEGHVHGPPGFLLPPTPESRP